nr:unnamed protein product [Spirometra erinaceieuropaei]
MHASTPCQYVLQLPVYKATELRLQRHSGGSSQSSLDQPTAEGVRTLIFTEISGFKNDTTSTAHLWVGTSRGVFFTLTVNPSDDSASSLSTCSVGGSLFRLEGEAVSIAFLDSLALPSRTCYHKVKITETSAVIRAEVMQLRLPPTSGPPTGGPTTSSASTSAFLACLLSNGHLLAFSLPSLRMLSDVDYLHSTVTTVPLPSLDQFTFGGLGHCIYMQSPSELVKITWAADLSSNLNEMHGDLFLPCTMPEPPKRNFFTNLFSGNFTALDRNELFGEQASGKPACGTAALLPAQRMDKLNAQSTSAVSDIARARNAAIERGERLAQLDIQTQEMVDQSKSLGKAASMLAAKYEKQDKWWGWPR